MDALEYQPARNNARYVMILMHGLGASGDDLFSLAPQLGGGQLKVVCPNAPMRAVTVNGGMTMRAWYDIVGVNLEDRQDEAGVQESHETIQNLIAEQKACGFASKQIFLAGFSQGGAMALHSGLRHNEPLAGIVTMSGYLLFAERMKEAKKANRGTPIFQSHGTYDPVVLLQWAQHSRAVLQGAGYALSYNEYPAPHAILPQTVSDLNQWLAAITNTNHKEK